MSNATITERAGSVGKQVIHVWAPADPRMVVVLAHGYGEHARRYDHVAERYVEEGAAVYAPDHHGHGLSEGERALVDIESMATDFEAVVELARAEHPDLPLIVLGHSMGGVIATRYAQRNLDGLDGLILSGPVIGGNPDLMGLVNLDPIPEVPIDPAVLSRDSSVGEAYMADELVYHGGFRRETLEAFIEAVDAVAEGPKLTSIPVLWIHGELDGLAPLGLARDAVAGLEIEDLTEHVYEGAQHEVLNETNKDEVIGHTVEFLNRVTG